MKLICNTQGLKHAFALAATVAPTRSPKEVLQNIKLSAREGFMTLTATDTEVSVVVRVDEGVEVPSPGDVLLPVAKTGAILRETSEESIALENNDNKTKIIGSRSKFQLLSQDSTEFPDPVGAVGEKYHEITAAALAELIRRTVYCTDEDSSRYALSGVQIETEDNLLYAVGTDGRRCAVAYAPAVAVGDHKIESGKAIIPARAARLIEKACAARSKDAARISVSLNDVVIDLPGCVIVARLVEGRYPNWRKLLPQPQSPSIAKPINGQFLAAVRQAAIATSADSQGIDFGFSDGTIRLSARSVEVGESSVEIPSVVEMSGADESVTCKMDNRFVREFCSVLDPEVPIDIEFETATSPVTFKFDGYQYVVMPMALN